MRMKKIISIVTFLFITTASGQNILQEYFKGIRACLKFYPPENQCLMNLASQKSSYLSR
jgi:hypothetical protein